MPVCRFCREHLYSILFVLCLVLAAVPQMRKSILAAEGLPFAWTTSKIWLQSAECARATLKFLVLCQGDDIVPIANGFGGDDLGHALALELYSAITQKPVQPADISRLNTIVNYLSLLMLAALLLAMNLPAACFLLLTAGTVIANQLHVLTPHPAQFGVACLVSILPLTILGTPRNRQVWMTFGFLALCLALLFREAIGMMGVVASLLAVLIRLFWQPDRPVFVHVLLLAAIVTTSATPYFLLRARDTIYHLPPAEKLESHGTWANLYMGLGGVENPFGIEWDDFSAINAVKTVNPSIEYLSPRFFQILRERYFEIFRAHPIAVLKVYLKKLNITSQSRLPIFRFLPLWQIVAALLATGALLHRFSKTTLPTTGYEAAFIVSLLYISAFLAQATLFNFDLQYLFPIQLFLLLPAGAIVDLLFQRIGTKQLILGQKSELP